MPTGGQRRLAASMIVQALQSLHPLLRSQRTDNEYFEAVEALVWLLSPGSDVCFEALGLDPVAARQKVDLSIYADLACSYFEKYRITMFRMYIATARYVLQVKAKREGRRIPYPEMVLFAENSLAYTTWILNECRTSSSTRTYTAGDQVRMFLAGLKVQEAS